jgi:hypothetical protein
MAITDQHELLKVGLVVQVVVLVLTLLLLLSIIGRAQAQTLSRAQDCREPGFVLATGEVKQATDNSDYFYIGGGLTISAPLRSAAVMRLRSLVGGRYRIVAVAEK